MYTLKLNLSHAKNVILLIKGFMIFQENWKTLNLDAYILHECFILKGQYNYFCQGVQRNNLVTFKSNRITFKRNWEILKRIYGDHNQKWWVTYTFTL